MRVIGAAFLILILGVNLVLPPAHAEAAARTAARGEKKGKSTAPKIGVQTPGVQIPFSQLKAEAEVPLPAAGESIAVSNSVFVASKAKNMVAQVDTKTNQLKEPLSGFNQPCAGIATAFGSMWVPNCAEGKLTRVDTKTGKTAATINTSVADVKSGIAATADSLWLLMDQKTTLARLDPENNKVVAELRLPAACSSVLSGADALWVTCAKDNKVLRVDPQTNLVKERIDVSAQPVALAFGENSVWVLCAKDGKVDRIDPKTNKVSKTIDLLVPNTDGSIAVGEGSVWVSQTGFPVVRIDPEADPQRVAQQFVGPGGGVIAAGLGSIWVSNPTTNTLLRLDPKRIKLTYAE